MRMFIHKLFFSFIILVFASSGSILAEEKKEISSVSKVPYETKVLVKSESDKSARQLKNIETGGLNLKSKNNLGSIAKKSDLKQPAPQQIGQTNIGETSHPEEAPRILLNSPMDSAQISRIRQGAIQPMPQNKQEAANMGWKSNAVIQQDRPGEVQDMIKAVPRELSDIQRKAKALE